MITKKRASVPVKASAPPATSRVRVRQLIPVKLTRFEWGVVVAALEVAHDGTDERSWISALEVELGGLMDEIATQAGVTYLAESVEVDPLRREPPQQTLTAEQALREDR